MTRTDWYPGDVPPVRRGLYERDWTDTNIEPTFDRRIHMDLWEPSSDPALRPGVWYVAPDWNDASRQQLPWRGLTEPAK